MSEKLRKRLLRKKPVSHLHGVEALCNPDGPEAAKVISSQAAEIAALREALKPFADASERLRGMEGDFPCRFFNHEVCQLSDLRRAAAAYEVKP